MSYSGYPYQQGPPPQGMPGAFPPYPQQAQGSPYPSGQAPYPQQPSFPSPYPNSGGYPGFGGPPTQMPQPFSMPMPDYSSSGSGYPPSGGAYPTPGGASAYPPSGGAYPHSGGAYPPAGGAYPPTGGAYPPTGGAYPSTGGAYPPTGGGYSPVGGSSGGAYPPSQQGSSMYPKIPSPSPYPHSNSGGHVPPPSHSSTYYSSPPHVAHATSVQKKGTPTVRPAEPFDPRADAETLRKAMKGFGTDEKAIIQVLAYRTNLQRLEISKQFKTLYGKDLEKNLKSELSGKFEDLVVAMMTPLPQYYAKEIKEGLSGIGTDEDVLIEVFCTMTNSELQTIRVAYESLFGRSLESDLKGDTSGTFKRLMVSLCTANRDESMVVDPGRVTQDAQSLLRAGELRLGTDESTFNAILCQRNWAHLRAVFAEYERITGHDFEKAIKNEFSGDAEEGLLAIVRSVKDKAAFFAKRIHESMKGMGTNDRQLIRLVVTRSEVDMGDIKQAYMSKYGNSLEDAISGDTSGDYKKCLIALITP